MARVLLALGSEHQLLAREVSLWGHVVIAEVSSPIDAELALELGAEVIIVTAALLERALLSAADRSGARPLVVAASAAERTRAEHLGALELVHPVEDLERLNRLLAGAHLAPAAASPGGALLITVCGVPGSPGASTLAFNLAAELAEHRRVSLIDLDCYAPALSALCGADVETPGVAAAARLVEVDAFSEAEFQRLSVTVAPGVRLLSGLIALEHWPQLSAERVSGMLQAVRAWSDVVVVDAGALRDRFDEALNDPFAPRRSASQSVAIELADRLVVVGAADPISLARLVRAWAGLEDSRQADLVINKLRAASLGVNPSGQARSVCREFLGLEPAALLPFEQRSSDEALLRAASLGEVAARSPLRRAVREFAHSLLPSANAADPPPGRPRRQSRLKPDRTAKSAARPA